MLLFDLRLRLAATALNCVGLGNCAASACVGGATGATGVDPMHIFLPQ